MASQCTPGEQAFAGAYVLMGCIFSISVIHESSKLIYRYQHRHQSTYTATPKYLLFVSLLFITISMVSLIKCILYGLVQCDYITPFNIEPFSILFSDLYIIQLYILWLVLMLRLYFTFQYTPFALTKLTRQMYTINFALLPLLLFLLISPSSYNIFIVISLSLSIFMTLSIIILFCYKLVQLHRYKEWRSTKQYRQYTDSHGLPLLTLITKHTILSLIATLFSFIVLLLLITIFVLEAYNSEIPGQQQLLDLCLLLDTYITCICVLYQFKYLHTKYLFCCNCIHGVCTSYCNKYFSVSVSVSQELQLTTIIQDEDKQVYHPPTNTTTRTDTHATRTKYTKYGMLRPGDGYNQAVLSQSASPNHGYLKSPKNIIDHPDGEYRVSSYDVESELGSIPDIPENETIDDLLRRLHSRQNKSTTKHRTRAQQQAVYRNISSTKIVNILVNKGFNTEFTKRAVAVYEKHYGSRVYDVKIVEEIIYRLTVKDKLKELKAVQNLYQSRASVDSILRSLNFPPRYVNLAILLYEVMAEMFEIGKYHENIYDLELITEIIMRLRAKFTEYGDLIDVESLDAESHHDAQVYIDCADPEIEDTKTHTDTQIKQHMPQMTQSTIDAQMVVVNHRLRSLSPDGYISTKPHIKHAANTVSIETGVSVPSSSRDESDEEDLLPDDDESDTKEHTQDDNHIIEVQYNTNMMNDGEQDDIAVHKARLSAIHEPEPIEFDSNNNTLYSSGLDITPISKKQYNVVIDFINTTNNNIAQKHQKQCDSEEVITMMHSDGEDELDDDDDDDDDIEEEDEKEILVTLEKKDTGTERTGWGRQSSFASRMSTLCVNSPPVGGEGALDYSNISLNRVRVEQELVMTERKYLEGLYVLYDEFIVPIFDNKLLDLKYKKQVMCNIPQLISFHEQFYEELKTGNIAAVFNKQSDYFKMYIQYVTEYKNILGIFGKSKRNRKLHAFLEEKRLDENKALISFLILPIQRVPRYMLLLTELKKKTPQQHGFEYQDIDKALQHIKLICAEINEKQREIENMSQCLYVSNKLKGLNITIVEVQRKYLEHFVFKQKKKKKNTMFFVFNDIVIIADMRWRVQQIVAITKFEAKKLSKMKNKELKIRILDDSMTDIQNDITYVVTTIAEIPAKDRHDDVSNIEVFCKVLTKYRSKLYNQAMHSRSCNTTLIHKTPTADSSMTPSGSFQADHEDDDVDVLFREEQEKEQLSKWQHDASKGNKSKVLMMLKSPSEVTNSLTM